MSLIDKIKENQNLDLIKEIDDFIEEKLGRGFKVTSKEVEYKHNLLNITYLHIKMIVSWENDE